MFLFVLPCLYILGNEGVIFTCIDIQLSVEIFDKKFKDVDSETLTLLCVTYSSPQKGQIYSRLLNFPHPPDPPRHTSHTGLQPRSGHNHQVTTSGRP